MLNNFIYSKKKSLFEEKLNAGEVLDEAIVFIEDTKEIWNHGTYFAGAGIADSLDFLPLSGGALSGPLTVAEIRNTAGNTLISQSSGSSTYVGNANVKTVLFGASGLLADISGSRYDIIHSGNIGSYISGEENPAVTTLDRFGQSVDINSVTRNAFTHEYMWAGTGSSQIVPYYGIASVLDISYSPDWRSQLYFKHADTPQVWLRSRHSGTTWTEWYELITSYGGSVNGLLNLYSPFQVYINENGSIGAINATNDSVNAWNNRWLNTAVFASGNNALAIKVDSPTNSRVAYIQVGHYSPQYASALGELRLNPFGGGVTINGSTAITASNISSYALPLNGNAASAQALKHSNGTNGVTVESDGYLTVARGAYIGNNSLVRITNHIHIGTQSNGYSGMLVLSPYGKPGSFSDGVYFQASPNNELLMCRYADNSLIVSFCGNSKCSHFHGNVYPNADNTWYLGASDNRWKAVYTLQTLTSSDIRYKKKVKDLDLSLIDISEAPSFEFYREGMPENETYIGTSAQYWYNILNLKHMYDEITDDYVMDYAPIALCSAISIAKELIPVKSEVKDIKLEIDELRSRVKYLESLIN